MSTFFTVLTYHPEIGTFRPGRGAWRVAECFVPVGEGYRPRIGSLYPRDGRAPCKALFTISPRRLRVGTFADPTKLLREYFAERRHSTTERSNA